ncbi:MAG TPA: hypothetical protein VF586_19685 [Pyrinomonadaceae bacterium]
MITQLTLLLTLVAALAVGASAPADTTNNTAKPPNPVQHSE